MRKFNGGRCYIVHLPDGRITMYYKVMTTNERGSIRMNRASVFHMTYCANSVKYTLKCARGLFRIRRLNSVNAPQWRAWWGDWEILKRGTTVPRDTVKPLTTFADIYRAFHTFNVI